MSGKLVIIVGGQYGSEAKGTIAAHLARTTPNKLIATRVAGPNAGHTVYDEHGKPWPLRTIPVAAVAKPDAQLHIAPGSEIDETVLHDELNRLRQAGYPVNLHIDNQATILSPNHIDQETNRRMHQRLGSTGKGIGAARAARLLREAELYGGEHNTATEAMQHLAQGGEVHIEGTQGYGLGLHAGNYPFCTSSDCRAIDFAAMAGITPWDKRIAHLDIWIVLRTHPIRVAGNSGPLNNEITFEQLSQKLQQTIEPEKTTVTQKIRRIGEWEDQLALDAIQANGDTINTRLALTFADYLHPDAHGITNYYQLPQEARIWIEQKEHTLDRKFEIICTGPQTLIDRRFDQ